MGSSRTKLQTMACFRKASPALVELLFKLLSTQKPMNVDHHLCEFGSVRYHVQATADSKIVYLSVWTPLLSPYVSASRDIHDCILQEIREKYIDVAEVIDIDTSKERFFLTLEVDFTKLTQRKDGCLKAINDIASLQLVILSSQLNDMVWRLGSRDISSGMYRPLQLVFHPGEPFFIIRMPEKLRVIFLMRFKDDSDVVIAASFFQELVEVSCSSSYSSAPTCTWSPIPPAELRGESLQSLSTNGGFMSFDIYAHHVKGEKMQNTIWVLLNFHSFVTYHVKCTRGFIQRKMRQHLESLSEVLQKTRIGEERDHERVQDRGGVKKLLSMPRARALRRTYGVLTKRFRRICPPIRIKALSRSPRRWPEMPRVSSLKKYTKLD